MALTHNLGFPRIGAKRELKFAVEAFWHGKISQSDLIATARDLRAKHWLLQKNLDYCPIGDFSLYDQVLDMSVTLGNLPDRITELGGEPLEQYFQTARGRYQNHAGGSAVRAAEMTKWFDTNYHFLVPEITVVTQFSLNCDRLVEQIAEAKALGVKPKPVIIGPATYLWLSKAKDNSQSIERLEQLLPIYQQLMSRLALEGCEWVQIDEPILVTEINTAWQDAIKKSYAALETAPLKLMVAAYFGPLAENLHLVAHLPVAGLHIDGIRGQAEISAIADLWPVEKTLSVGIVDGRNIWKTDLTAALDVLEPLAEKRDDRLWVAPSSSLLHVPVDLDQEAGFDDDIRDWLAFASQKIGEIEVLGKALNEGREAVAAELVHNRLCIDRRKRSTRVRNSATRKAVVQMKSLPNSRQSDYFARADRQKADLKLPLFPTTTIGSFPQTAEIRKTRKAYKNQQISLANYTETMQAQIKLAVDQQESLGLDVFVHGEAERNDMVEYFGEQLEGCAISQFGWVQSYGSRCVKPPIIYGDIHRSQPMTVNWSVFAQSLTNKPMKGMLTGPVTILNWSFVRDDQPRSDTCFQLALAIREEVLDLERSGVKIIQIDEAALREGLPLRRAGWQNYLDWAVAAFRFSSSGVKDNTQIHTHMCYSEFNDIMAAIIEMDADVITIETSRSDMELLAAFDSFAYPNEIGPGVYDIHSPNIPTIDQAVELIKKAAERIPAERLWVNPDCGLKTRQWQEVVPALQNMVSAAKKLRAMSWPS